MKKLHTWMMLAAFPMLLNATENKEPEKICLNKGWDQSIPRIALPHAYIRNSRRRYSGIQGHANYNQRKGIKERF